MKMGSEEEPDVVITAEETTAVNHNVAAVNDDLNVIEESDVEGEILEHILVPDVGVVINQVISSPLKQNVRVDYPSQSSQVLDLSQPCAATQDIYCSLPEVAPNAQEVAENSSDSNDSENCEYVPHTDDSREESEVVELRKHARKFRKKNERFQDVG